MPQPPGSVVDINILTTFYDQNCETTWTVYIETLFKATKNLTLELLAFGVDDVVRGYFRPVAARKWRHGRKARKGFWKKIRIPETGEMVAKWIPGQEAVAGRYVDDGLRWLWHIDTALQKYLYIIMIHELINDYWMDFQSGIIKSPETDCGNLPRMMRTGESFSSFNHDWAALPVSDLVYAHDCIEDRFAAQMPAGQYIAIFAVTALNNGNFPGVCNVQVRIRSMEVDHENWAYSSLAAIEKDQSVDLIATLKFHGPASCAWESKQEGNQLHFTKKSINVFRVGPPI